MVPRLSESQNLESKMSILNTEVKNVKNVGHYTIGEDALSDLSEQLNPLREKNNNGNVIFFIDEYFKNKKDILNKLDIQQDDEFIFVTTIDEPTTEYIDQHCKIIKQT